MIFQIENPKFLDHFTTITPQVCNIISTKSSKDVKGINAFLDEWLRIAKSAPETVVLFLFDVEFDQLWVKSWSLLVNHTQNDKIFLKICKLLQKLNFCFVFSKISNFNFIIAKIWPSCYYEVVAFRFKWKSWTFSSPMRCTSMTMIRQIEFHHYSISW